MGIHEHKKIHADKYMENNTCNGVYNKNAIMDWPWGVNYMAWKEQA